MGKFSQYPVDSSPALTDSILTYDAGSEATKLVGLTALKTLISANIDDDSIDTDQIVDDAVTTDKVADDAITMPKISNPYMFMVYRNAAFNWATGWGKISFDTEVFDLNSDYDNSTNYRYDVPVTGYYHFDWSVGGDHISGGGMMSQLKVNGTARLLGKADVPEGYTGTFNYSSIGSGLVYCEADQYVEIEAYGAGNSGNTGQTVTFFCGHLVSMG